MLLFRRYSIVDKPPKGRARSQSFYNSYTSNNADLNTENIVSIENKDKLFSILETKALKLLKEADEVGKVITMVEITNCIDVELQQLNNDYKDETSKKVIAGFTGKDRELFLGAFETLVKVNIPRPPN